MWASLVSLPWRVERPTILRRAFWQACAGLPLTALAWWGANGLGEFAWMGLFTPSVLVLIAFARASLVRSDDALRSARGSAHAAVYSTLFLFFVFNAPVIYWGYVESPREPLFRVDAASARVPSNTTGIGLLDCRLKHNRRGRQHAEVRLSEYPDGRLRMARTPKGKVYAVWRLDAPNDVATQYPMDIIVNAPKSLPVLLRVDFGPYGFPGHGLEVNGKQASFRTLGLGPEQYMWLPGGRSVIFYAI